MVNQYLVNQQSVILKSDLAGEFPIYIYWSKELNIFLYTKSIKDLLNDVRIPRPLTVCDKGLSFLLQSNVVPPPQTAYKDVYIIGIGDKAEVFTINNKICVEFDHSFPFFNNNRLSGSEMEPDENFILQMLAEATIDRIDKSKPIFLFHSAGKDSNTIALALAEAGWQDRITLVTHKSEGKFDETESSKKIAKKLGFKHKIIHKIDELGAEDQKSILKYLNNIPFPSTDGVTLGYPLYLNQLPQLKDSNIIDGGGNDSYMMILPSKRDLKCIPLSKLTHKLSFFRYFIKSESLLSPLVRTPAEWCGMSGLSFADSKKIYKKTINVFNYWKQKSFLKKNLDLIDFKTRILTPIIASELHIRKVRNFADSINSNLILPFANQKVASYFSKLPEKYLFDRKNLANKIVLRKILKKRIGLDSDALGKMSWNFDAATILKNNWKWFSKEIYGSDLWDNQEIKKITNRLFQEMMSKHKYFSNFSGRQVYRLYLLSVWKSKNKYLNY